MPPHRTDNKDEFTASYTLWTLLLFITIVAGNTIDDSIHAGPFIVLGTILSVILWLIVMALKIRAQEKQRHWRKVASIFLAPFLAIIVIFFACAVGLTSNRVKLELFKPIYTKEISQLPLTDGFKLKVWEWGESGGGLSPQFFYYLVYDESDQITLSPGKRSPTWMKKAEFAAQGNGFYSVIHPEDITRDTARITDNLRTQRISGHYYMLTEVFE